MISGKPMVYRTLLAFITLTGFAQMPIFKRYYIADIPGLGWLAQFYVTHALHYIFAGLFIALCVYAVLDFFLAREVQKHLTAWAWLKTVVIFGLVLTGLLMVVRNLPEIYFPHSAIILLNILHLSLCILLLGAGGYTLVRGKKWME